MSTKPLCLLVCTSFLLATALGCGSGSSSMMAPPLRSEFLYAFTVTPGSNPAFQLSSFKVDVATGGLSPTATLAVPFSIPQMAVDPASKFLYLTDLNPGANSIDIFSLDPATGAPTPDGAFLTTTICAFCPPASEPGALAIDPKGRFLYYGSSTLGAGALQGLGALSVNATTGALSAVAGSPFSMTQVPFQVMVHPSGQFVYTANLDASGAPSLAVQSISEFSVNPTTGVLTSAPGSPLPVPANSGPLGPLDFAIHPSGKFLYATTGLAANGILAWSVDGTTGALSVLPGTPFDSGAVAVGLAFDPMGKFLYVTAGAAGGILGFSVDGNSGALTPLPGSPFASSSVLGAPTVDPSGAFLFAASPNNMIAGFRVDAMTGALTPLSSPTMVSAQPVFMAIARAP